MPQLTWIGGPGCSTASSQGLESRRSSLAASSQLPCGWASSWQLARAALLHAWAGAGSCGAGSHALTQRAEEWPGQQCNRMGQRRVGWLAGSRGLRQGPGLGSRRHVVWGPGGLSRWLKGACKGGCQRQEWIEGGWGVVSEPVGAPRTGACEGPWGGEHAGRMGAASAQRGQRTARA